MVDCKECSEYVGSLLNRGDITKEEVDKIILDRHILKGCDKKTDPFMDWLNFAIKEQEQLRKENVAPYAYPEWNKGYLEGLLDAKTKYCAGTLSYEGTS